jgi:HlyD family secretion protein
MRPPWLKRIGWILVGALGLAGAAWFAWPGPIPVDLAVVAKGPMEVTVEDEGKTRVRHIYIVSAPLSGKVLRTSRHVGDHVVKDETVVAVMQPTTPSFHDARTHEELQAALAAAEAAVTLVEAEVRRMEAAVTFSRTEMARAEALVRTNAVSLRVLDKARLELQTSEAALASAKAQLEVRRNERASVAARLVSPTNSAAQPSDNSCCIQIRAPVTGRVLKINQESEAVVLVGTPLIEIGDPKDIEIVADLLSSDAVRIKPGAEVKIDGWGGAPIDARVVRVDPAGFTKVSALGIEEQRVRTTIDFVDPPETWSQLGHDYRVIVHVTVWKADSVLTVPVGALFRKDDDWAVFVVRNGRARVAPVQIGYRNNRVAQLRSRLAEGDRVVLHPSDRITDGSAVAERPK